MVWRANGDCASSHSRGEGEAGNGWNEAAIPAAGRAQAVAAKPSAHYATGVRAAVDAWGLDLCAVTPDLYTNTVSAIRTPDGFNASTLEAHAAEKYGVAFGTGLGDVAGKVYRIGHLGSLTDVMTLSGIATAEMCMVDLGLNIKLGSGVAAAQDWYRRTAAKPAAAAKAA